MTSEPSHRRSRGPIRAGVIVCAVALAMMSLPLLIGRWEPNKYLVAAGFLLGCLGISCIIHGIWDLWRR